MVTGGSEVREDNNGQEEVVSTDSEWLRGCKRTSERTVGDGTGSVGPNVDGPRT